MTFDNEFNISDVLTAISLLLVIIGGLFTLHQWRKNLKLKRAEYINELTEKIRSDEDVKHTIYLLEYDDFCYDSSFHNNIDIELPIDKTLSTFSYICYLRFMKIITENEFDFFSYEIRRILQNCEIQRYLYFLFDFSNKQNVPMTFKYLFDYGIKKGYLNKEQTKSKLKI